MTKKRLQMERSTVENRETFQIRKRFVVIAVSTFAESTDVVPRNLLVIHRMFLYN